LLLVFVLGTGLLLLGSGRADAQAKGRSYSSGSSGGKSYSSGSSSSSKGGFTAGKTSSSSGRSYSSGSSGTKTSPAAPPPSKTPAGKSYSSGRQGPSGSGASSGSSFPRGKSYPAGGGSYDSAAAEAQRKAESRSAYTKGQQPRPNYTDSQGNTRPLDPSDRRVEDLRRQLDPDRWATRERRQGDVFGTPAAPGPVVVYRDPYSNVFWWWLLSRSLEEQAQWAYHHRNDMDEARYRDMLARSKGLEDQVRKLEAGNVSRDPTYVPAGVDPDLVYTDEYVDAVWNPQHFPSLTEEDVRAALKVVAVVAVLALLIWLVFIKRWGSTADTPDAGPDSGPEGDRPDQETGRWRSPGRGPRHKR
jgi:hypothetical protein